MRLNGNIFNMPESSSSHFNVNTNTMLISTQTKPMNSEAFNIKQFFINFHIRQITSNADRRLFSVAIFEYTARIHYGTLHIVAVMYLTYLYFKCVHVFDMKIL